MIKIAKTIARSRDTMLLEKKKLMNQNINLLVMKGVTVLPILLLTNFSDIDSMNM